MHKVIVKCIYRDVGRRRATPEFSSALHRESNVETRSYLARISQQSQVQIITRYYYTGVPCDTLGYVATVGAMPEPGTQPN